jgi:two-component system sensor histidine kinase HydH
MKQRPIFRILLLALFIIGISLLHYFTPLHLPVLHDIFQRLYYIPIILAAFWFGLQGGLAAAIVVSILYAPHILFQWGARPSLETEKFLEIVLYNIVGGITGFLSQQGAQHRDQLEQTARRLEESYHNLQRQADLFIAIEEQLRRAERLSALGELSAVLAHEIRNPLGSIKGTAEILRDSLLASDRNHEFLEILIKEADRLNRVVEDFLGLARPVVSGKEEVDLLAELEEVVVLTAAEARQRGVAVELARSELPPVLGDREKLRQVFLNLIQNALQATGRGGRLQISATRQAADDQGSAGVLLTFADSGVGIAAPQLAKVFDPFYTTKEGGTGLGLAIVQKIIESHGGRIQVESTPGKGTTFRVWLRES